MCVSLIRRKNREHSPAETLQIIVSLRTAAFSLMCSQKCSLQAAQWFAVSLSPLPSKVNNVNNSNVNVLLLYVYESALSDSDGGWK